MFSVPVTGRNDVSFPRLSAINTGNSIPASVDVRIAVLLCSRLLRAENVFMNTRIHHGP